MPDAVCGEDNPDGVCSRGFNLRGDWVPSTMPSQMDGGFDAVGFCSFVCCTAQGYAIRLWATFGARTVKISLNGICQLPLIWSKCLWDEEGNVVVREIVACPPSDTSSNEICFGKITCI